MKIVFTTSGNDLDASLDSRFGRAPKFLVYDTDSESHEVVQNLHNLNAAQGAGIQSAQTVAGLEADAVVTGHCGPKAFRVLAEAGIEIYCSHGPTIRDALDALTADELPRAAGADVEGHWV